MFMLQRMEEKKALNQLIESTSGEDADNQYSIQVYIGDETPIKTMNDCSLVTATYELEEGVRGKIGIIGPKRMDYEKVVDALQSITEQLDHVLDKKK